MCNEAGQNTPDKMPDKIPPGQNSGIVRPGRTKPLKGFVRLRMPGLNLSESGSLPRLFAAEASQKLPRTKMPDIINFVRLLNYLHSIIRENEGHSFRPTLIPRRGIALAG